MRQCEITDCERKHLARGWCKLHYGRWQAHGSPHVKLRTGPKLTIKYGDVFGRLVVLRDSGERNPAPLWECSCECGNVVRVRGYSLIHGETRSCGCLQRDIAARRIKDRSRKHMLRHYKKKYGLDAKQVEALFVGGCAICGRNDDLCIDHDHMSGRVRAVLCRPCNTVLGMAGDDPVRLRAAADYLEGFS